MWLDDDDEGGKNLYEKDLLIEQLKNYLSKNFF